MQQLFHLTWCLSFCFFLHQEGNDNINSAFLLTPFLALFFHFIYSLRTLHIWMISDEEASQILSVILWDTWTTPGLTEAIAETIEIVIKTGTAIATTIIGHKATEALLIRDLESWVLSLAIAQCQSCLQIPCKVWCNFCHWLISQSILRWDWILLCSHVPWQFFLVCNLITLCITLLSCLCFWLVAS